MGEEKVKNFFIFGEEKVKNFSIFGEEKVKNSSLFLPWVGTLTQPVFIRSQHLFVLKVFGPLLMDLGFVSF